MIQLSRRGNAIRGIEDWRRHAGPKSPDQWQPGRSAFECARAWCASGVPVVPLEIQALLTSHPDTTGYQIVSGVPEHQVRFDKVRGEPRNADLALIADGPADRLAISVEAKADESFGEYVGDVAADALDRIAHGARTEVIRRLEGLITGLLPPRAPRAEKLGRIRYQLLTAAAGALAFAQSNDAAKAVLIVHEFRTERTDDELHRRNAEDLDRFVSRLTSGEVRHLASGQLRGPIVLSGFATGPRLYVGKARRDHRAAVI